MAKYEITHSCRHRETVEMIGSQSERESRIAWMEGKPCLECLRRERAEANREAAAHATAANAAAGLPPLQGSPRQVAWAETLRATMLPVIEARAADFLEENARLEAMDLAQGPLPSRTTLFHGRVIQVTGGLRAVPQAAERAAALVTGIREETRASWWIDRREGISLTTFAEMARAVILPSREMVQAEEHRKAIAEAEETRRLAAEAQAEATLRPEKARTETVCEIRLHDDGRVTLHFPEKRMDFWELVKRRHGFLWEREAWARKGDADKAVEMGVAILAMGIPVRIYDDVIRSRVAAGEQIQENTRRVTRLAGGKREGWFCISWKKSDGDYYAAARRLPGARWEDHRMVAPPDAADEVAGFAETEGFDLSAGARETIAHVLEARQRAVTVSVTAPTADAPRPRNTRPTALAVPAVVEVADDLRDDH